MIDKHLIQRLKSDNPKQRKKAIMALAKTEDRDALPYLAQVYKSDPDSQIRELAKKAGIYINKNTASSTYDEEDYDRVDAYDSYDDYGYEEDDPYTGSNFYDDPFEIEEEEHDVVPLPSEIQVSDADIQRAQGLIDQVVELNLRGDNRKAEDLLRRAVNTNPRLIHDSYTRSISATVMRMSGDEAMALLSKREKSASIARSPLQSFFGFLLMIAAASGLISFFGLPWIDFSSYPVQDSLFPQAQVEITGTTIGEQYDQMGAIFEKMAESSDDPRLRRVADAFNALTFSYNGLDTTLISLGVSDTFTVSGFTKLFEIMIEIGTYTGGDLDELAEMGAVEPHPLDYTIPLAPLMAGVSMLLSFILMTHATVFRWVMVIIAGLIGLGPLIYVYLVAINKLFSDPGNLGETYIAIVVESPETMLAYGFWISIGAMFAVVFIPFIALLLAPGEEQRNA